MGVVGKYEHAVLITGLCSGCQWVSCFLASGTRPKTPRRQFALSGVQAQQNQLDLHARDWMNVFGLAPFAAQGLHMIVSPT